MNVVDAQKKCVGCGACIDVCPVSSLKLIHNENGFYEPVIVNEKCINCGKCLRSCPALNTESRLISPDFYYGWNLDDDVRRKSTSGGLFSALAEHVLTQGGVVFGARYADDHKSVIMSSTEECSLDDLRRSKYCQSYSDGLYTKIDNALKQGKKVMLAGSPCQIAAAKRLFGDDENLILVDFVCGGVAPQTMFSDYITHMERKYGPKVKSINMRDKALGWGNSLMRIEFADGRIYQSLYQFDYYYNYYNSGPLIKNDACLSCLFTQHNDADITIADFWGYKQANVPKDIKGMSLISAYSDKGKTFLDLVKPNLVLHPLRPSDAAYAYKEKHFSKELLLEREEFLNDVKRTSFVTAAKRHHFKNGKWGVLMKLIVRKVVRK